jgi:hypothetical protein
MSRTTLEPHPKELIDEFVNFLDSYPDLSRTTLRAARSEFLKRFEGMEGRIDENGGQKGPQNGRRHGPP